MGFWLSQGNKPALCLLKQRSVKQKKEKKETYKTLKSSLTEEEGRVMAVSVPARPVKSGSCRDAAPLRQRDSCGARRAQTRLERRIKNRLEVLLPVKPLVRAVYLALSCLPNKTTA